MSSQTFPYEFLTMPEVSSLLRRSASSVYKDVEAHRIPAYKIGGRLVFDREKLVAWIEEHSTLQSSDRQGKKS